MRFDNICHDREAKAPPELEEFNWDRYRDKLAIIIRAMLYGAPCFLLQNFPKGYQKEIFLTKINLFRGPNRAFWKLMLEIEDEELDRATKNNPKEALKIWPY